MVDHLTSVQRYSNPADVLREELSLADATLFHVHAKRQPLTENNDQKMADLVATWERPIILVGGGVLSAHAADALRQLARRLNAPVFHTLNGKSVFPADHPLHAGLPWMRATSDLVGMESFFSPLLSRADGLLAVGCRFSQATTGNWKMPMPASLLHIDIDPAELGRHYPPALGIHADARLALEALLAKLPEDPRAWSPSQFERRLEAARFRSDSPCRLLTGCHRGGGHYRLACRCCQFPVFVPRILASGWLCQHGLYRAGGARAKVAFRIVL